MRIGILSTYNSKCGIAEYTEQLADAFLRLGNDVTVFCNYGHNTPNNTGLFRKHGRELRIMPQIFGVWWWEEPVMLDFSKVLENIIELGIEVLHIQYQSSLYKYPEFNKLLRQCPVPIVVTMHDSSVHTDLLLVTQNIIVHKQSINTKAMYIPFPIPEIKPRVMSMGMGRTDKDFVSQACSEIGIDYYHHDGKERWLNRSELIQIIKMHDAVVLWYNDTDIEGNSAAARLALACHRPLIVNDIGWFNDVPNAIVVSDKKGLQKALKEVLNLDMIKDHSVTKCAEAHIDYYRKIGVQ